MSKKIVVVGGVAGGATAAARARRLSEDAEIVVLERGPHVSFANCGLPYFLGREITEEADLVLQTPESLRARFNIDVRVRSEVTRIDRSASAVEVCNLSDGSIYREPYDALILSPGARPVKPPIPGIDRPGHFTLRNVPDVEQINAWLTERAAKRAVVVGGGFIGLEMTEQLARRGARVSLVEALPQVMSVLDCELAALLHSELERNGVDLHLGDAVAAFDDPTPNGTASTVVLRSGARLPADIVILAIGVRPETDLAREAGLQIGELGGIRVDEGMRTSDEHIWAVGDAVEVKHAVTGKWCLLPLAGPANRQGRIAADQVMGRDSQYSGSWGTGILRLFDLVAAGTGANERMLLAAKLPCETVYVHPSSHAGYYPGADTLSIKLIYEPKSGRLLGAQVVGREGADKRIDVLATALQARATVDDLAALELAYAPPFGSAKDPVNLAGMAAGNALRGDVALVRWNEVEKMVEQGALLLDVRTKSETDHGTIPGAITIPLNELRARLEELPRDRDIVVYCRSGQRSYYACRTLIQHGFRVMNLTGAYLTWTAAAGCRTVRP